MNIRAWVVVAAMASVFGQDGVPRFEAKDVRPHGAAEPHPLVPGLLAWIFGTDLADSPGCGAQNLMDPSTYKTELCGTRVVVGGIEARLIAAMPGQINLVLPDHAWENEMVTFQVIRNNHASTSVPVYFGFNRPTLSLTAPAYAGLPVWLHVEKPWGNGWARYPFYLEPWDMGPDSLEVRYEGRDLPRLPMVPDSPIGFGKMMGLPREVPREYLGRLPLHLLYPLDRPGYLPCAVHRISVSEDYVSTVRLDDDRNPALDGGAAPCVLSGSCGAGAR